jgi:hypothetical protein
MPEDHSSNRRRITSPLPRRHRTIPHPSLVPSSSTLSQHPIRAFDLFNALPLQAPSPLVPAIDSLLPFGTSPREVPAQRAFDLFNSLPSSQRSPTNLSPTLSDPPHMDRPPSRSHFPLPTTSVTLRPLQIPSITRASPSPPLTSDSDVDMADTTAHDDHIELTDSEDDRGPTDTMIDLTGDDDIDMAGPSRPSQRRPQSRSLPFPRRQISHAVSPDIDDIPSHYVFNTNTPIGRATVNSWSGRFQSEDWEVSLEERHAEQVDYDRALPSALQEAGHPIFVCIFVLIIRPTYHLFYSL